MTGRIIDERYEVIGELGHGGMGHVYEVSHLHTRQRLALKSMAHTHKAELRERFIREARITATIQSPHIVQVHDAGVDGGHYPYLVMELLAGESLQRKIDRDGPLGWSRFRVLAEQLAAGLSAAHAAGVVHRDLKPANVMLTEGESRWHATIIDFGLAHVFADDTSIPWKTHAGQVIGSPAFMSPEQIRGEKVGPASDVYALGALLYYCLTGRAPFQAKTLAEFLYCHVHVEAHQLSVDECRARGIPLAVPRLLQQCLAKQPELRPKSVKLVAEGLRAVAIDEHLPANPARRNKAVYLAVAAGALLTAMGGQSMAVSPTDSGDAVPTNEAQFKPVVRAESSKTASTASLWCESRAPDIVPTDIETTAAPAQASTASDKIVARGLDSDIEATAPDRAGHSRTVGRRAKNRAQRAHARRTEARKSALIVKAEDLVDPFAH